MCLSLLVGLEEHPLRQERLSLLVGLVEEHPLRQERLSLLVGLVEEHPLRQERLLHQ
jgi:hypothetical protein